MTVQGPGSTLIATARATRFSRGGIAALAAAGTVEAQMQALVEATERDDLVTATKLALALIVAGGRIPASIAPKLIAETDDMRHACMIATRVDADPADFAVRAEEHGALSNEREAMLCFVAAETLSGAPPERLVSCLRSLSRTTVSGSAGLLIGLAALKLDHPQLTTLAEDWIAPAAEFKADPGFKEFYATLFGPVLDQLDELAPPRVIGDGHTVVRTEKKVGRNDPCPCGSKQKYKKCCAGRDDAAPPAPDRAQEFQSLSKNHRLQDHMLFQLRPHEIAQLDPQVMSDFQVIMSMRRLLSRNRWSDVERFMEELARRSDKASEYRSEIIERALSNGAIEVAERQIEKGSFPDEELDEYRFRIALARREPGVLETLEARIAAALAADDFDSSLATAFALLDHMPALGILVARGTIRADRPLDTFTVLEEIGFARDKLGIDALEPWWDVFDAMVGVQREDVATEVSTGVRDHEVEALRDELRSANARAGELSRELSAREQRLATVPATPETKRVTAAPDVEALETERRRLRMKVGEMKAEISAGNEQRAELRRKLAQAVSDAAARPRPVDVQADDDADESAIGESMTTAPRKVLLPRFSSQCERSIAMLPRQVAADAVREASHLAAGEITAWSGVKRMRRAPDVLTCRIGRSYRLLFRLTGDHVEVVDVIHRRELETALQRLRA